MSETHLKKEFKESDLSHVLETSLKRNLVILPPNRIFEQK
jgi:hypothetical protein